MRKTRARPNGFADLRLLAWALVLAGGTAVAFGSLAALGVVGDRGTEPTAGPVESGAAPLLSTAQGVALAASNAATGELRARLRADERSASRARARERRSAAATGRWPGRGTKTVIVRSGRRLALHDAPGGRVVGAVGPKTEFGSPVALPVLEQRGSWIATSAAETKANEPDWMRLDASRLTLGRNPYALRADLGERRVELRRNGRVVKSFPVTIGAAGSSTPYGRFAVTDVVTRGLSPVYGCCAIALSAHQPNLPGGWIGGTRVAIHGTSGPVGAAASSGCLRATNAQLRDLIRVLPLGTPVTIEA